VFGRKRRTAIATARVVLDLSAGERRDGRLIGMRVLAFSRRTKIHSKNESMFMRTPASCLWLNHAKKFEGGATRTSSATRRTHALSREAAERPSNAG
jgi:hypothetical protein